MWCKRKFVLIKFISLLLITGLFITINSKTSFAKMLTIDWDKLQLNVLSLTGEIQDGVYTISCAKNSNYVLDIAWKSLDWGGNLQICKRNQGTNQKFYISYEGDGYYKIANVSSALIIDVENSSQENGANIRQWEDNGDDAQRWKIKKNDDGTYNFIAKCSGKALDVDGGIFEESRNVQQWDYINSDAQRFKLEKTDFLPDGIVSIKKATNYNISLDINDMSSRDGENLQIWQTNESLAQRFYIYNLGNNEIRIRTVASGGFLTENGTNNGSDVIQSGNSSTPVSSSNTWEVGWNSGITLKNKESGLYLDIKDDSEKNGTKVQVREKNSTTASQRFIINQEQFIKNGIYEIASALGTTLDLENGESSWGTNILTWESNNQNNQKFRITYTDSGYLITTVYGLALDVENGSMENGANVRQWEDNGDICQRWWPKLLDGGYIRLKNAKSGKYLDVANASAELGANVQQYEASGSKGQMWKLVSTNFSGWFSQNGSMYCIDPQTNEVVKNCTRVDPTKPDPSQYGSIYDFDAEGRATWHLPIVSDLPGGTGPSAPIPTLTGDQRQRTLQLALSRLGCPYELLKAPTGFVCDGLTSWSVTTATGIRFRNGTQIDDQDMSWQHVYIREHNGLQTDISQAKPGDIIFWGNPANIENHGTYGSRHVSIFYHDDIMIHAAGTGLGVREGSITDEQNAFGDFIDFGSPYTLETSQCPIPHSIY